MPAIIGLHIVIVVALLALTFLFGRLYCSVICPLGVSQDLIARVGRRGKKKPYSYSPAKSILRYTILALVVVAAVVGVSAVVSLLDPYAAFGRIANNLLQPLWQLGNNALAFIAERVDSYAFYRTEVWIGSLPTFIVALLSLGVVSVLAWRGGRTYCNTICPVGTLLGVVSKYSIFGIKINSDKCNSCGLCAMNCKASCIDIKSGVVDTSRCVTCMNCVDICKRDAINYTTKSKVVEKSAVKESPKKVSIDNSKRNMLTLSTSLLVATVLKAEEKSVDGGLATIEDKKIPIRNTPILPPGAISRRNFSSKCTGCQLCVTACPNNVLRPAVGLTNFMQPELSYERGFCRPECTKCSEVCPAGAIQKIDRAEKSSIQIGHAVWIEKNCVVLTDGVSCGNCAVVCPTGAIMMVKPKDSAKYGKREIPVVNTSRCIGCGACENLCPARPFSAIYVEGYESHDNI